MNQPLIAKEGFITRLHAAIKEESGTDDYTYEVLLSERTGDQHGEIVVIAGKHCIEKASANRFVVWFMNSEEAEPWTSCKSLAEAMDELKELEKLNFA